MAKQLVVSKVELSKSMLGGWKLDFACPACRGQLNTKDSAIGQVDDCPLCGAEFLISPKVRDQIQLVEEKEARENAVAEQNKSFAAERRRKEKRQAERARQGESGERRRKREQQEFEKGYGYPNLRRYQKLIEFSAILNAIVGCIVGCIYGAFPIINALMAARVDWQMVAGFGVKSILWFFCAAVWYFTSMISAESLRLFITAALDIRAIRDATSAAKQVDG